jgi:hypothetical protein
MADEHNAIGRVCYYARQQCRLAEGCPTIGIASMGDHPAKLTFRAMSCAERGVQLYPDEMVRGRFDHSEHRPALREVLRERRAGECSREIERKRKWDEALADSRQGAAAAIAEEER